MEFSDGETVVFTLPGAPTGGYDDQGNPIIGPSTTVTVTGVGVAPLASDETEESYGPRAVNGYTLILPYGTNIPSDATALVRGVSGWQVQGDSGAVDWRSPFSGWEPGTIAVVRRSA